MGSAGIYSALVIAGAAFRQRVSLQAELSGLRQQLASRPVLAAATAQLMAEQNCDSNAAYQQLRLMAMNERLTIEAMAARVLEKTGDRDDRRSRA